MQFIELFAGKGGFRAGLSPLDFKCVGWVEWDKWARKAYEAIWPEAKEEWSAHDITTVTDDALRGLAERVGTVDLIAGGFPCQAFSVAGKRGGFEDTRGTLFFEVARFANVLRPKYLLLENVVGLLNHAGGGTFRTILSALDELGYDAEWQVLNATDFGIPQNRERVFIVGHFRGSGGRKVFPLRCDGKENSPSLNELTRGIADAHRVYDSDGVARTLKAEGGGLGAKTGLYQVGVVRNGYGYDAEYSEREVALTIDANYYKGLDAHQARTGVMVINADARGYVSESETVGTLRANAKGNNPMVRAVLTPDREEKRQNERRFKDPDEPMFTLTAQDKHGVMIQRSQSGTRERDINGTLRADASTTDMTVMISRRPNGIRETGDVSNTLRASAVRSNNYVAGETRIRRLTPRECWRLMGRQDWEFDRAKSAGISDSQLYKLAGNGLIPQIVTAIARNFERSDTP